MRNMEIGELSSRLQSFPRVSLCQLPTPLHPLSRLSEKLGGPELWIKRDDMTGFGMGGNKGRKLEFLMGQALQDRATEIITCGAQQSNHARQTAAAAAAFGLPCRLLLKGGPPTGTGNQTLYNWLDAKAEYLGDISWSELKRRSEQLRDDLLAEGQRPCLIPVGGSTPLGALGYVQAAIEFVQQVAGSGQTSGETSLAKGTTAPAGPAQSQGPQSTAGTTPVEERHNFDFIYIASSSLATQAGLAAGLAFLENSTKVVGVLVDLTRPPDEQLASLANGICELLGLERTFSEDQFICDRNHIGDGYAIPSQEGVEAIRLLAKTEGIFLDPVYSGKAFAGLLADIRAGKIAKDAKVVFWHTGGSPALFAEEYAGLPRGATS